MNRLHPLPLLLLICTVSVPTTATAARWFQVETVIFARTNLDAGNEVWPADPGRPALLSARPLLSGELGTGDSGAFLLLSPERLQLVGAAERLRRSPRYRVLFHEAWRQPVSGRESTPWVRIGDGSATGTATGAYTPPPLEGVLRLSVRRYLHLDVDLVLTDALTVPVAAPPTSGVTAIPLGAATATQPQQVTTVWQPFRMQQSRRMRSEELHYIDHPAFGMLVLVTPYVYAAAPAVPTVLDAAAAETPAPTETGNPPASEAGAEASPATATPAAAPAVPTQPQ